MWIESRIQSFIGKTTCIIPVARVLLSRGRAGDLTSRHELRLCTSHHLLTWGLTVASWPVWRSFIWNLFIDLQDPKSNRIQSLEIVAFGSVIVLHSSHFLHESLLPVITTHTSVTCSVVMLCDLSRFSLIIIISWLIWQALYTLVLLCSILLIIYLFFNAD